MKFNRYPFPLNPTRKKFVYTGITGSVPGGGRCWWRPLELVTSGGTPDHPSPVQSTNTTPKVYVYIVL